MSNKWNDWYKMDIEKKSNLVLNIISCVWIALDSSRCS